MTEDKIIYGRNPVLEALGSGAEIDRLIIQKDIEGAGKKIYALAKKAGIPVQSVDRQSLNRIAGSSSHQGVIAYLSEFKYSSMGDILAAASGSGASPFVVLLDGIEDPQNLGAIIRSALGAGCHGVVIPTHRAAPVTAAAVKASAGAAMYMPVARVGNLSAAIEELKRAGMWIYGLDMDGEDYRSVGYSGGIAVVVGSEGGGISRLVKEKCDRIISIPMRGQVNSLNASAAAAVALFRIADGL